MSSDNKRSESVGTSNNHGNTSKRLSGQRHLSDPAAYEAGEVASHGQHGGQDPDLFAILSSMHLTNQLNSLGGRVIHTNF